MSHNRVGVGIPQKNQDCASLVRPHVRYLAWLRYGTPPRLLSSCHWQLLLKPIAELVANTRRQW